MSRIVRLPLVALLAAVITLAGGTVASAAPADKLAVLSSWTQTSAASQSAWASAQANRGAWSAYAFDWSTDYCSSSPDNPLGFNFKTACQRHDFGYRNYRAAGQFSANKARVDSAFYNELLRKCDTYSSAVRPACDALAWTYYQAVKLLGVTAVSQADLDRIGRMKAAAEERALASA